MAEAPPTRHRLGGQQAGLRTPPGGGRGTTTSRAVGAPSARQAESDAPRFIKAALAPPLVSTAGPPASASSDWRRQAPCAVTSRDGGVATKARQGRARFSFSAGSALSRGEFGCFLVPVWVVRPWGLLNADKSSEEVGAGGEMRMVGQDGGTFVEGRRWEKLWGQFSRDLRAPRDSGAVVGPRRRAARSSPPRFSSGAGGAAPPTCRWPGAGFVARPT